MEESRVPGENYKPVASHWQTLSHNVVSGTPELVMSGIRTHNLDLVVISTDCTGSCKSLCHTITMMTKTIPYLLYKCVWSSYFHSKLGYVLEHGISLQYFKHHMSMIFRQNVEESCTYQKIYGDRKVKVQIKWSWRLKKKLVVVCWCNEWMMKTF